jgi:hypothetical protein
VARKASPQRSSSLKRGGPYRPAPPQERPISQTPRLCRTYRPRKELQNGSAAHRRWPEEYRTCCPRSLLRGRRDFQLATDCGGESRLDFAMAWDGRLSVVGMVPDDRMRPLVPDDNAPVVCEMFEQPSALHETAPV